MSIAEQAKMSLTSDIPNFFKGLVAKDLFVRHLLNGLVVSLVFVVLLGLIPQTRKLVVGALNVRQ